MSSWFNGFRASACTAKGERGRWRRPRRATRIVTGDSVCQRCAAVTNLGAADDPCRSDVPRRGEWARGTSVAPQPG